MSNSDNQCKASSVDRAHANEALPARRHAESPCLQTALRYANRGWKVFPTWPRNGDQCGCGDQKCRNQGKHPIGHLVPHGFKDATVDEHTITKFFLKYPDAGIGLATGSASGILVIDVDNKNNKDGNVALRKLEEELGGLPETKTATTPSGGRHLYYKDPGGISSGTDKLGSGVDVKADGGYVVVPPSHDLYKWADRGSVEPLPQSWVARLHSVEAPQAHSHANPAAGTELVAAALAVIPNGASVSWGEWNRVGMATFRSTGGSGEGFRAFDAWSAKWPHYNAHHTRRRWETYRRSPPDRIGAGTIFHLADEAEPGWRDNANSSRPKQNQADLLIELARDAELFHTSDGIAFADVKVDDHCETWRVNCRDFKRWLLRKFYIKTHSAPNRESISVAVAVIEAQALFGGWPTRKVHVRIADHNGKIYVDLANDRWEVIEIDETGWRVVPNSPVKFCRTPGMQPLPMPRKGGKIKDLWYFLNIEASSQFNLLVAWILASLRPRGPYPILVLIGEEGTGKSTLVRFLRELIDPNKVALRALPREERDLYIAANNSYLLAFDNVSHLPNWLSDALCRIATGGGYATRSLYTDTDETLIDVTRPAILNGVEDFVARPDLADRCIFIRMTPIPDKDRRPEAEMDAEFEEDRPYILGALLDAMVVGLRNLPKTRLDQAPRMADFARWAVACEPAMFKLGSFAHAYQINRRTAVAEVIDADAVADAVRTFMLNRDEWLGSAGKLYESLWDLVGEQMIRSRSWPDNARGLRSRLQRAQASLRKIGIAVTFDLRAASMPFGLRSSSTEAKPARQGNNVHDLHNMLHSVQVCRSCRSCRSFPHVARLVLESSSNGSGHSIMY